MRDQEIVGLWEAYASIYTQTEQTVEEEVVDEDLQQKVGQALDAAAKNPVVQAIGKVIAPVGQGRKTPTKDGNWRPVVAKEETEEVDEATKLAAVARKRAEELGRKRRSTKEYKQGLNRRTGGTERRLYDLSNRQASRDASLETQKMSGDTGAHGQNYADRIDKRDPKKNPKHDANKENINASYEYDLFDIILEYLVAEGYADTNKAALAIMANMSEEWKQSIVEGEEKKEEPQKPFTGEGPKKPKGWKPTGPKLKTGQRPGYAR